MKSNTTKEYPYTLDYYSYVVLPPADGSNVNVKDYSEIPVNVVAALSVNLAGELIIESPEKIQFEAIIANVLDRNGDEIYQGGTWIINQTAPILGPLGIKGGYKYRASILSGNI